MHPGRSSEALELHYSAWKQFSRQSPHHPPCVIYICVVWTYTPFNQTPNCLCHKLLFRCSASLSIISDCMSITLWMTCHHTSWEITQSFCGHDWRQPLWKSRNRGVTQQTTLGKKRRHSGIVLTVTLCGEAMPRSPLIKLGFTQKNQTSLILLQYQ